MGERTYEVPSAWDQLSGEQFAQVAEILHSKLSTMETMARLLYVLTEMRKHPRLYIIFHFRLSAETQYDWLQLVEWVLRTPFTSAEQLVPTVRHKGRTLYGPLKECRRFVFVEFIEADMAYLAFRNANNEAEAMDSLDRLFAILYRDANPIMKHIKNGTLDAKWNGDPRCRFNENILDYAIELIRKVPVRYKYAALMHYANCHDRWEKNNPAIFKKAGEGDGDAGGGWGTALRNLAGGSLHMEEMLRVNAAAALNDLNLKIIEAEEMERSINNR